MWASRGILRFLRCVSIRDDHAGYCVLCTRMHLEIIKKLRQ